MKTIHRNDAEHTTRSRDAALRRLGRANRWLLAGSVVLTGVLTDVAANAFPGHKLASRTKPAKAAAGHKKHKPLARPSQAPTTTTHAAPAPTQTESAPSAESAPSEPAPETQPAPETHAAPETTPAPVEAPAPETHESAPAPEESSAPVVSGGS